MQWRRLIRAVFVRPDLVRRAILAAPRPAVDSSPCRGKGGRGGNGISSNGWGREGFRWARIHAPSSPGKSSDDHVQEWTLFSHSRIGRSEAEILTPCLSNHLIGQREVS